MSNLELNPIDEQRGMTNFTAYAESDSESIIKVVGVGGGGGNAVASMYNADLIRGVTYLLCNTDAQALRNSGIPSQNTIVLGPEKTKGLGAGNKPGKAREAAEESANTVKGHLTNDATRMVFITAGMGGGTGTGAAPVIGKVAQEADLLTVGIVTIPFLFEGTKKIYKALEGVNQLREHVDALLVVNNQRLIEMYGELSVSEAFRCADATLSTAARGISDLINSPGYVNLDFADVETTLKNSGVAVISSGIGSGTNRLDAAIKMALNSPLLNNNNIYKATRVLIGVYTSTINELKTAELAVLDRFTEQIETEFDSKFGLYYDDTLEGDQVRITILAAGFDYETTLNSLQGKDAVTVLESKEQELRKKELIKQAETFYGTGSMRTTNRNYRRPLLLTLNELDNEELIAIAEDNPAIDRDLRAAETIRERYQTIDLREEPSIQVSPKTTTNEGYDQENNDDTQDNSFVISFE